MRIFHSILIGTWLVATASTASTAADAPAFGPVPAWVRSISVPDDDGKGEAAVRMLLLDNQVHFEKGAVFTYVALSLKVQTPQGLAAGNISLAWRPETDRLTVHRLRIHRGADTIDVLASGQTFTVLRREQNLESATLDGVLTANIQPEGLQVGDVLEYALTVESRDPVLAGHVEQLLGNWNSAPVERAHLRAEWPSSLPVRIQQTGALPKLKPVISGDMTSIETSIENLEPVNTPKGAPARFRIGRLVELSDFRSWADAGALLGPLYIKAAQLPAQGPLRTELDHIRAGSSDPKARAEAALALVQDRIRYVALAMGSGGLIPADAATTWSRRYGDCKAKTALLLGLLWELGIEAQPVAVNAFVGDGIDARLPMLAMFNHVIVRVTIAGRTYWLDGTRTGDGSIDRLVIPDLGWGLPLVAKGAALVKLQPPPLVQPNRSTSIHIDARKGIEIPAPVKIEVVLRGDDALATHLAYVNLAPAERERVMRENWRENYDFIEATSVSESFDKLSGEQRMAMEGLATLNWRDGWYETDGTGVGYDADFAREPGPDRDAPFSVVYPYYHRNEETILLPPGFSTANLTPGHDVDETVAGIEYRRKASLTNDVFHIERTARSIIPEFPAAEAPAAQTRLRRLNDLGVYLRRPEYYAMTEQEIAAALVRPDGTGIKDVVDQGSIRLDSGRLNEAEHLFSLAIAADPKNVSALAGRGLALAELEKPAAAARDIAAALAIDPKNPVARGAQAKVAGAEGRHADAIEIYTTLLAEYPTNSRILFERARAYRSLGKIEAALDDSAAVIKQTPSWIDIYLFRANLLRFRDPQAALAEAIAAEKANPKVAYAYAVAASIYSALGKDAEALRADNDALAIEPEAYIYLSRSRHRTKADIDGRMADLNAALKLEPDNSDAIELMGKALVEKGDLTAARAFYDTLLKGKPTDPEWLVARGLIHVRMNNPQLAQRDFSTARAQVLDGGQLNNMCWEKATAGLALESAFDDCSAAIAKEPDNPTIRDSHAFVQLRLGRIDGAIADYDAVLAKSPQSSPSLYGRSLAWSRKGDTARADADAKAAIALDPQVEKTFAGYGLTR